MINGRMRERVKRENERARLARFFTFTQTAELFVAYLTSGYESSQQSGKIYEISKLT